MFDKCIPSPTLNVMLREDVAPVTVIGSANFTRPSSFTTSPVLAALCSLLSTKYPIILAVVSFMPSTSAFDENASSWAPN